jgi:hypothetical protein
VPRLFPLLAALLSIQASILPNHAALAQDGTATDPEPGVAEELSEPNLFSRWTFRFEPAMWYVSPGGRFRMPGEPAGAPRLWVADLNLDSPRVSPFGELHLRATEVWRFTVSGFALELEDRGSTAEFNYFLGPHAVAVGDRVNSSLNFASGDFLAGWRLPLELGEDLADFEGRVELLGGARFIHFDLDVQGPGFSLSEDLFFVEPVVGIRLNMEITRRFSIDLQNTFGYFHDGGDKSSLTWDINAGFMYFPLETFGVQIGYRQLFYRLRDGPKGDRFEWNGANAGIYGGVTLRF